MTEPSIAVLGGNSVGATLRRYLLATRPAFFTAAVLPVIAGTAWGAQVAGAIDWLVAAIALVTTVVVQAAANVYNDVGDELNGSDRGNAARIHPFTGGSRFIQNGILSLQQMRRWARLLFSLAIVLGAWLAYLKGPGVVAFGLAGMALGALYSWPAVQLSGRGVGELAVAAGCGLLPVCGAAWLQSGVVDWPTFLIAIPISCWVAAILLINEVPDREADAQAGKRTWPVRFGVAITRWIYVLLYLIALASLAGLWWLNFLPLWSLVFPAALLVASWNAANAIVTSDRDALQRAIKMTLAFHASGSIWLILVIIFYD